MQAEFNDRKKCFCKRSHVIRMKKYFVCSFFGQYFRGKLIRTHTCLRWAVKGRCAPTHFIIHMFIFRHTHLMIRRVETWRCSVQLPGLIRIAVFHWLSSLFFIAVNVSQFVIDFHWTIMLMHKCAAKFPDLHMHSASASRHKMIRAAFVFKVWIDLSHWNCASYDFVATGFASTSQRSSFKSASNNFDLSISRVFSELIDLDMTKRRSIDHLNGCFCDPSQHSLSERTSSRFYGTDLSWNKKRGTSACFYFISIETAHQHGNKKSHQLDHDARLQTGIHNVL